MGVLSLYKVFRNNTGQKKRKRREKRERLEENGRTAERRKGKAEKRRAGGKGERRKGIYWRKEGRKRPRKEARDYSYYKEEVRGRQQ
ncbi:MAG: hypothetical protein EGP82_01725 [Odoribacter splanchnicus]|nr:hypothetical protein [Odoribacter splanchnicus]